METPGSGIVTAYITRHIHSTTVGTAFAQGCRGRIVRGARQLNKGPAAFYGWLRGLEPLLRQAQKDGRTWYYLDNGYFAPGHYSGYYRVTRGAYQHNGAGEGDLDRLHQLGVRIQPWRRGEYVLVCPPGDLFAQHLGFKASDWLQDVTAAIAAHTDRPIRVRVKGASGASLADDLKRAHCLVTGFSNAAVEALVAGVPVFCTHRCAAFDMGTPDLSKIEEPRRPDDRERWAGVLAANQWTLEEMKRGRCAADLGLR